MKKICFLSILAFLPLLTLTSGADSKNASLEAGFNDPAMEYGPRTWWHWINENVSKDGITKDLEAMKIMGYKGAHVVNLPQGGHTAEEGEDVVGSPIWMDKMVHATKECERLGLELSMGSCAGWVAGGPWISGELSMQEIVWRHHYVEGGNTEAIQLPQPTINRDWYSEVAVLAYPSLPGEATPLASLNPIVTSNLDGVDWSALMDGDSESFVELPAWKHDETMRSITFEFPEPITVRSLVLEMHEDSSHRMLQLYISDDGQHWKSLVNAFRWRNHFDPCREERIEGFADQTARFVKLDMPAPTPKVGMKMYELNFLSARLNQIHTKAARQRTQPQISDHTRQVVPAEQIVKIDEVLDLTQHLQADGSLDYTLPAGQWTILRFGHTSNGNEIHPASERAGGLECDKMSVEALHHHMNEGIVKPVFDRLGPLVGEVLLEMNIDSWEAGCQTWTAKFPDEFKERRGYDLRKWLIGLTGRFIESTESTERFLWDYRRTIGDLIAFNFYDAFREYVNDYGLKLSAEAPGIGIPIQCDQIQVQGMMDIPQGEFWLGGGKVDPRFPQWPGGQDNTKEAAVAAHVYGKEVVSCEAFTSFGHHDGFTQYPHILKPVGDRQFCKGMNEIVFHRYVHQPDDRVPGVGLGQFGLNLERTTTWWEPGREWITYLRRCQYMLRQGRFFADVCYYYGEDVPGSAWYYAPRAMDPRQKMKPVLPKGYDYDVCDRTTFDTMWVEDGYVALPSGMRYRYLVLPDHARYTPAALQKVYDLVVAGATVIGPRPSRSASLSNIENADQVIEELAAKIWPLATGAGERRVGKGRVITGKSFETILADDKLEPDFKAMMTNPKGDVRYIHRKIDDGEMYFVASQSEGPEEVVLNFRVSGMQPELWDPSTGERSEITMYKDDGAHTAIPLRLESFGSKFILFRKPATKAPIIALGQNGQRVRNVYGPVNTRNDLSPRLMKVRGEEAQLEAWEFGEYELLYPEGEKSTLVVQGVPSPETIHGAWYVSFQKDRAGPEGRVVFDELVSWTERPEDAIKYFSGTASYKKIINVEPERLASGRRVYLDLGQVNHLAEVVVNGQSLPVLWKPPFRVDISSVAKAGANKVEVKVTNVWKNRLLGDKKLPEAERSTWTLYPFYHNEPDAPLMESGLLGPVRLISSAQVPLSNGLRSKVSKDFRFKDPQAKDLLSWNYRFNEKASWSEDWKVVKGTFELRDQSLIQTATSDSHINTFRALALNPWLGDGVIEAKLKTDFTFPGNDDLALYFRMQDDENGYCARIQSDGFVTIGKIHDGIYTHLKAVQTPISSGQWYDLRVELQGPNISVYLNETKVVTAQDTYSATGLVGFGMCRSSAHGYLGEIRVREIKNDSI